MDISLFRWGIELPRADGAGRIVDAPLPQRVGLLLRQTTGRPATPTVEKGDAVSAGQKVASGAADLHASISGEVLGVEELHYPDGSKAEVLVIQGDGQQSAQETEPDPKPLSQKPDELLKRISLAGVIQEGRESLGLAAMIDEALSPDGHVSATGQPISKAVEHLVVRCVDVDPHMVHLAAVAQTLADDCADLALGLDALLRITGAAQVHIVLDQRQQAPAMEALAEEREWNLVRIDAAVYPAASEPLLAALVSGREPEIAWRRVHNAGTLVLDVDTVLQVTAAVRDMQPVIERVVTVRGPQGCQAVRARIGTSMADLATAAGQQGPFGKLVLGGPLVGLAHHSQDFPLAKDRTGLTLFAPGDVSLSTNEPCISCGLCAMVCPMRIMPGQLSRYCEYGKWDMADDANLFSCLECGACAYVCPAGRSIVQFIVQGKNELLATRRTA